MKKMILIIAVFLPAFLIAQTEGTIQFEEKISMEMDLPEEMKEFKDQIPTSQTMKMTLVFNSEAALYAAAKNNEPPEELDMGNEDAGIRIKMRFDQPENKIFTDLAKNKTVEKREFMGKMFLIKGELEKSKWKMTGEQEKILDYACQKATYTDEEQTIVAWFTPQIPVSAGPAGINGLPGMILKIDIDEGQTVIEAKNVDLQPVDKNLLKAPKKGKKVSKKEFEKIRDEKMKEMQAEYGGSGSRIIIRN